MLSKKLIICILAYLLLSNAALARQWTDAQIGSALYEMNVVRSKAQITQMIEYGMDGPQGQHLQLFLWEKLAEAGPHTLTDDFAKLVLEDPASPKLMKFGALGYLAYAPEDWMRPYATAAISDESMEVKCGGYYLAAVLGMSEHYLSNKDFASQYNGTFSEYPLLALAETMSSESLYSTFKETANDGSLATAMAVAKFRDMTDEQQRAFGGAYYLSGDPEISNFVLVEVLSKQKANWLLEWGLIIVKENTPAVYEMHYHNKDLEKAIRVLGYNIVVSGEGALLIEEFNRASP